MNICFVVYGSASIGMGHIMRCLALAEAFQKRGHHIFFFSKYKEGIDRIRKQGFPVCCLSEKEERKREEFFYGCSDACLNEAYDICQKLQESADLMVIDSYNVTEDFFLILKKKADYLAYIDDLNAFPYPVDFLINGNASAFNMEYEKKQSAKLFLGLKYNLIRQEFGAVPSRNANVEVRNILITTGNSDPFHMTEKILDILMNESVLKAVDFHVIIGSGFNVDNWKSPTMRGSIRVHFYNQPEYLSAIMLKCDLAISAGGSTIYELAACGVPMIVFSYAENQIPQILAMEEQELLKYLGDFRTLDRQAMVSNIKCLMKDYRKRKILMDRLQSLVDVKGTSRTADEIEICIQKYNMLKDKSVSIMPETIINTISSDEMLWRGMGECKHENGNNKSN